MTGWRPTRTISVAEKYGCAALLAALVLGFTAAPQLAAIPLSLFLLACLVAPFLPGCSFFLPVISRGQREASGIALTFDDGPSPASTPVLLELLAQYELPATFFVIGRHAAAHPELIAAILAQGHAIGNHSYDHDNLLMLRSRAILEKNIQATQEVLNKAGIHPLVFRPPIGIISPRLQPVLASLGLHTITFSCRIFDRGNRNVHNLASRVLKKLRPGDILLLHDIPPPCAEATTEWINELHRLFAPLHHAKRVVPLAVLIDHPVMMPMTRQAD
jgi:peptidoglycan/xylan/chitin deacetylase (PgdA/CDA1 family)